MNQLVEQNLSNLVQELTTSGSKILNEDKMKQLKQICKQTDVNIEYCYRLLIEQLKKQHSEIRYSTFQIIDQLFQRSHHFRTLLLDDFNYLIDKSLGLNIDDQLPPPKPTAKLLKQFAASSIKKWHEKFGTTYKLLDISYNYLKNCKFFNFDNVDEPIGITAELERERVQANQLRLAQKLQIATQELNDTSSEIYSCIKQAENCLNLLVSNNQKTSIPTVTEEKEEAVVDDDDDDDDDDNDDDFVDVPLEPPERNDRELLQVLGLSSGGKYEVTINLSDKPKGSIFHIEMTEDNRALVENLHDLYRQLDDVFLNKIQSWTKVFIQVQENSNSQQIANVMKKTIDMKNSIKNCLRMIENYHLAPKKTPKSIEKSVRPKLKPVESQETSNEPAEIPTLTEAEIRYYFQNDTESIKRSFKQCDVQNAFVRPSESDEMPDNLNYSLLTRKRTFVNELPAIKWKCRAPLGNGKLCERMDRYKCPFHGRIIARNEQGQAEDDKVRFKEEEQERAKKRSIPEWQDPDMLEDIRLATGIDLRMSEANKRKKKKKKNESGLTVIGAEEDTARNRLEKKIFNRSSLKRIGAVLDADERRRNEEKFHHQFNYSLNE